VRLLEPLCHDMSDWWRAVSYIVIFPGVVCIIFGGAQWFLVATLWSGFEVIMHRGSNQALERTAARRTFTFQMTKTFSDAATLTPGGDRSAWSR